MGDEHRTAPPAWMIIFLLKLFMAVDVDENEPSGNYVHVGAMVQ